MKVAGTPQRDELALLRSWPPSVLHAKYCYPSVHQPAQSQQPQKGARFLPNPIKRQPQQQPTKEAIPLHSSPAQSQETTPETDSLETAQVPTVEPGSEPEDSVQQIEKMPIEGAICVAGNNLGK